MAKALQLGFLAIYASPTRGPISSRNLHLADFTLALKTILLHNSSTYGVGHFILGINYSTYPKAISYKSL